MNIHEIKLRIQNANNEMERMQLETQLANLKEQVEHSIRSANKEISYTIREWTIQVMIQKYQDGIEDDTNEIFIPDYQRDYKWDLRTASRFIESIFLNFPIPYLYMADVHDPSDIERDGRVEVVDGSQRIRALYYFLNNALTLTDLKELTILEGFTFDDLPSARKRRFLRETIRCVELKGEVTESYRRDLFERINSGMKKLVAMEVRHGSQEAESIFYKSVIIPCSTNPLFESLAPLSDDKKRNADHRELVLRFFAYYYDLDNYNGSVKSFLDNFLKEKSVDESPNLVAECLSIFESMLNFVSTHIGIIGFRKTDRSKTTPRARYEAISVGVALALKQMPTLTPVNPISQWLFSDEFQRIVGADSANNTSQLLGRINYVKNKLLES